MPTNLANLRKKKKRKTHETRVQISSVSLCNERKKTNSLKFHRRFDKLVTISSNNLRRTTIHAGWELATQLAKRESEISIESTNRYAQSLIASPRLCESEAKERIKSLYVRVERKRRNE